jgi:hypothetical protein
MGHVGITGGGVGAGKDGGLGAGEGFGGEEGEDDVVGVGVVEEGVVDEVDGRGFEADGPFLGDDAEDGGFGAAEALGDAVDGCAGVEGGDDGGAVQGAEGVGSGEIPVGEDGGPGCSLSWLRMV